MGKNVLKLKIIHESWSERCAGMWESTSWEIYDDLTTEIFDSYGDVEKDKKYVIKLENELFKEIMKNVEKTKMTDKKVEAYDGSAWSVAQYEDGKEIWSRKAGYIYGIESLEKLANILNNLISDLKANYQNENSKNLIEKLKMIISTEVRKNEINTDENVILKIIESIINISNEETFTIAQLINYEPYKKMIDPLEQGKVLVSVEEICNKIDIQLERASNDITGLAYYYPYRKVCNK